MANTTAELEAEVREAIEAQTQAAILKRELTEAADPSQTPEELIGKRGDELVDQIGDRALSELRDLRDRLDDLMRALKAKRDACKAQIRDQIELASQAIQIKDIAEDAVARLTRSVNDGLPQPGARVITQSKRNGAGA